MEIESDQARVQLGKLADAAALVLDECKFRFDILSNERRALNQLEAELLEARRLLTNAVST